MIDPVNRQADSSGDLNRAIENVLPIFRERREQHRAEAARIRADRDKQLKTVGPSESGRQTKERIYTAAEQLALSHDFEAERWDARIKSAEAGFVLHDGDGHYAYEFASLQQAAAAAGRQRFDVVRPFGVALASIRPPKDL
jgi:hypothetical protein